MRILAIRGQNLASLDQPFEVDLDKGPLGRAGLFAITGPTGAGKSTLLDAVCLCLYDRTPRLAERGGHPVRLPGVDDDAALSANDVRNVLRRGASEAWAEVDFRSRDGQRYCARWECRRARGRSTGKIQTQALSLRDAQGRALGGTKTETLAAIQARVGLSFDQFRRSVLLAQGDFAAFLRADESERAHLLEAMTGTEIYTRLSVEAFRRHRQLQQERHDLETRRQAQGLLSDAERALALAALQEAAQAREAAAARVLELEAGAQWYLAEEGLQAQLAEARQALARAEAELVELGGRQAALQRAERGWGLRALAERARATGQERARALAEQAQAQGRATEAQLALEAGAQALLQARRARLGSARALEEALVGRLARARTEREEQDAWRVAHPQHQVLASPGRLQQLEKELEQRRGLQASLGSSQQERARRVEELERAATALQRAERLRSDAQAEVARTRAARTAVEEARPGLDPEALAELRRRLEAQARALDLLRALREKEAGLAQERQRRDGEAQHAQQAAAEARAAERAASEGLSALAPRLDEARAALDLARRALDAGALRTRLQEGQPCEVCGSLDHPWAAGSPVAELHGDLLHRVEALLGEQRGLEQQRASSRARAEAEDAGAARARQRQAELDAGLGALAAERTSALAAWALAAGPSLAAPGDAIEAQRLAAAEQDLGRARAAVEEQEAQARSWARELHAAQEALALALGREQDAQAQAQRAGEQRLADQASLAELDLRRLAQEEQLSQAEARLSALLEPAGAELPELLDWRVSPGILAACAQAVGELERRQRRRDEAEQAEKRLEPERIAARQLRQLAEQELAGPEGDPPGLDDCPTPCPPPGPPTEQGAWLQARVQADGQALEQARLRVRALEEELTRATERARAAAEALSRAEDAAQAAARALEQGQQARGLDADALAVVLALPEDWLDQERGQLRAVEEAPAQARVLVAERERALDAQALTRPGLPRDELQASLEPAARARREADEAWGAARARLQADDAARQRVQALDAALGAHDHRAGPWLQLAECIGSAEGDKLKRFAQSLTLEQLLEQANLHLKELSPRYSLHRVDGTNLDLLVVDHDLGGEPRTIQSLSGGEAFLTSLALALGLSSLSSQKVRVESLFIDEGFGTLDARSLDSAISVLDGLQASGRQVGVISHVGGLAERIGVGVTIEPLGGGRSRLRVG